MASVGSSQPCVHGKQAICRFIDKNGNGCRWGDACHYCHQCRRVTAFSRIQQVLASRRTSGTSSTSPTPKTIGMGLVGLLRACPELLLEGCLGAALTPETISVLPAAHPSLAALITGGAALLFWRLQFRRLCVNGLSLSGHLLNSLSIHDLRRAARAFGGSNPITFKSRWHFDCLNDLIEAVSAAESTRESAFVGYQLFAFSCRFRDGDGDVGENGAVLSEEEDDEVPSVVVQDAEDPIGNDAASIQDNDGDDDSYAPEQLDVEHRDLQHFTSFSDPVIEGDAISFPDGQEITVVPMLVRCRVGGKTCQRLTPTTWCSDMETSSRRNMELQAAIWSASPRICAFEALALQEDRPLDSDELSVLLGSPTSANPESAIPPPVLRFIVAIRCVQRFWEVRLK